MDAVAAGLVLMFSGFIYTMVRPDFEDEIARNFVES